MTQTCFRSDILAIELTRRAVADCLQQRSFPAHRPLDTQSRLGVRGTLTRSDSLRRIHGGIIHLLLDNLAALINQECRATAKFHGHAFNVFLFRQTVLAGHRASPVAKQRESHAILLRECEIRKRTVHAHTQNLGVGAFQLCQVLLESFDFLRSTTGEGEHIKGQRNILFSAIVFEGDFF